MGRQVYQRKQYKVYKAGSGYIVHNSNYAFFKKHTHIKSYYIAKKIIDCVVRERVPKKYNLYILESLIRITGNKEYIKVIEKLIYEEKQK